MIRIAIEFEKQGPGSISKDLFWYHDGGKFTRLPYEIGTDQKLAFKPPPAFVEMLETFKEPAATQTAAR